MVKNDKERIQRTQSIVYNITNTNNAKYQKTEKKYKETKNIDTT